MEDAAERDHDAYVWRHFDIHERLFGNISESIKAAKEEFAASGEPAPVMYESRPYYSKILH